MDTSVIVEQAIVINDTYVAMVSEDGALSVMTRGHSISSFSPGTPHAALDVFEPEVKKVITDWWEKNLNTT